MTVRMIRSDLLSRYQTCFSTWRALDYRLATQEADDLTLLDEHASLLEQIQAMHEEYRKLLPAIPVSRCPHSGRVLYHAVDHYGLDGLWWDYECPIRPIGHVPDTLLSLTGALKPGGPFEVAPFLANPGPEIPYVIPELLAIPRCIAVISSLQVGVHTGYPVCYFIDSIPSGVIRAPTWGSHKWEFWYMHGGYSWGDDEDAILRYEYDLNPYIRSGAVMWISPGDMSFTLKKGEADCPYTGLEGRREMTRIRDGRIMTDILQEE